MALHKLYNCYLSIGGVDLSDHVKSVTLNTGAESLDSTVMSNTTRAHIGGLLTWDLTVDFGQDYAASKVDVTLSPLVGTVTAIEVRPDAGSVSTTNPKWTGSGLLTGYKPLGGTVGDFHMTQAKFESGGTLTRATS